MPPRVPLTSEQLRAAASTDDRVFIVAVPGSGKTTVACERYGVLRFNQTTDSRRVLGLSFARSATFEFSDRVRGRWGSPALAWPHRVATLDAMARELVQHMLSSGRLTWPGGHTQLNVLDTWRGQQGARFLLPEQSYRRVARIDGTTVKSAGVPIREPLYGFGQKRPYEEHLAMGICTHQEVRAVLRQAMSRIDLRPALADYLNDTVRALIVDEIFDANDLDLEIVLLSIEVGMPVTLVGDPWQALYEFRGARPDLVPRLVNQQGFSPYPISNSFRFETGEMKTLTSRLRAGLPVSIKSGAALKVDVVLSAQWDTLWEVSDSVLPLSFGRIDNQTDAAIVLLLDQLVRAHFQMPAIFSKEAVAILDLNPELLAGDGRLALMPILRMLQDESLPTAETAMQELRTALRNLGSPRQLRRLPAERENVQLGRLQDLGRRVAQTNLIPGMTVHQAKGKEWQRVGIRLSADQAGRLANGLSPANTDDRLLYVALTRARRHVCSV
jgi:DNA helicase II / ATP-dependent DNA helicase PcrA